MSFFNANIFHIFFGPVTAHLEAAAYQLNQEWNVQFHGSQKQLEKKTSKHKKSIPTQ